MGKKAVVLVVTVTLAVLIFGWYILQSVIMDYDVDRDTSLSNHYELNSAYLSIEENQLIADSLPFYMNPNFKTASTK
ncbi:hypothetical protein [Lentibacillus salicampi]|uniref:Uncharacterized protein n=1 Tax=Lentibacillus salicampi TaxID=175306 RepID=A0A4Y9ACU0_9BACI|nr:hypothetical protein [Lentibacillus salicampi]TFJ92740.1 hypothetical protein E4U82_10670 [Lentibacillus salicampi]